MAAAAAVLFLGTVFVWVPAAAVYFDASERRQTPYLWGVLALVPWLNVIVVVAYLVRRARAEEEAPEPSTRLATYLHVAVLTFWGLTAVGVSALLYGVIHYARSSAMPARSGEPREVVLRQTVAFALALLVIALPALAGHGVLLARVVRRELATAAGARVQRLEDALGLLLTVLGGLTATLAVVLLVFEGFGRLFDVGGPRSDMPSSAGFSVLPAAVASVVAAFALFPRRAVEEEREPGPPATVAVFPASFTMATRGEARFCAQCGAAMAADARFCPQCGSAVLS